MGTARKPKTGIESRLRNETQLTWADAALKVLREEYDAKDNKEPIVLSELKDTILKLNLRPPVENAQLILNTALRRLIKYDGEAGKKPSVSLDKNEAGRITVSLSSWESKGDVDKALDIAMDKANRSVRDMLINALKKKEGEELETIIANLFTSLGYDVTNTGGPGDEGVDVMFTTIQEFGSAERTVLIQVKGKPSGRKIGITVVQQFIGTLDTNQRAGKGITGIIVTTSDFDDNAKETANKSTFPISLIGIYELADLLIRQSLGVRKKRAEYLELDLDSLTPTEYGS